jgi:hypothetical protein
MVGRKKAQEAQENLVFNGKTFHAPLYKEQRQ